MGESFSCDECGRDFDNQPALNSHVGQSHNSEESECPTCDRLFPSERAMKNHHAQTHGESIARERKEKVPCPTCEDKFVSKRGVSIHHIQAHDESIADEETECTVCGSVMFVQKWRLDGYDNHLCSPECDSEWRSEYYSGREILWTDKLSEANSKPYREPGIPYGDNWHEVREKVRERDQNRCQICRIGEVALGRKPDVHHIIPRSFVFHHAFLDIERHANQLGNLITLCRACHARSECGAFKLRGNVG